MVRDALRGREPVHNIVHVSRDWEVFWNTTNKLGGWTENQVHDALLSQTGDLQDVFNAIRYMQHF